MEDNQTRKSHSFFIFFCLLILGLVFYFFWLKPKFEQKNSDTKNQSRTIEVTFIKVEKREIEPTLDLPGRVASSKISEIRPQVDGIIEEIKFVEGGFVQKGQQLYQIDPRIYQAAFNEALANFTNLQVKKARYQKLLDYDAVSKQEFSDVAAAFVKAESELKKARTNLAYTKVYAPISGYIGKSNITVGALVSANQNQVLTTITALDPIYVDLVEASKNIDKLQNQKNIRVTLITDDKNYQNDGILKFTEVFADETTDSVRMRAIFSNKDKKLIPGMFVNARLHLNNFTALTVPQRSTNRNPDGSLTVWVIDQENNVKLRIIKASQIYGDSWIIDDGLSEGEMIVYEGFQKISENSKVKPIPLEKKETKVK